MGQKETAVTATGKNRIMIYGPKNVARTSSSLRASLVPALVLLSAVSYLPIAKGGGHREA
jgi:hypothetical protein